MDIVTGLSGSDLVAHRRHFQLSSRDQIHAILSASGGRESCTFYAQISDPEIFARMCHVDKQLHDSVRKRDGDIEYSPLCKVAAFRPPSIRVKVHRDRTQVYRMKRAVLASGMCSAATLGSVDDLWGKDVRAALIGQLSRPWKVVSATGRSFMGVSIVVSHVLVMPDDTNRKEERCTFLVNNTLVGIQVNPAKGESRVAPAINDGEDEEDGIVYEDISPTR